MRTLVAVGYLAASAVMLLVAAWFRQVGSVRRASSSPVAPTSTRGIALAARAPWRPVVDERSDSVSAVRTPGAPSSQQGQRHRRRRPLTLLGALIVAVLAGVAGPWALASAPTTLDSAETDIDISDVTAQVHDGRANVTLRLKSSLDGPARAWFFLARPGDPDPWTDFAYRSEVQEVALSAGSETTVRWSEHISVPTGLYQVTVWVHRPSERGWVHADGGAYGLEPLAITGPDDSLHQRFGGAVASLELETFSYDQSELHMQFTVTPQEGVRQATFTWDLRPAGREDEAAVFRGRPRLLALGAGDVPLSIEEHIGVPVGVYDVWIEVATSDDHAQRQLALLPAAVVVREEPAILRRAAPSGSYQWVASHGVIEQTTLLAGEPTTIDISASRSDNAAGPCSAAWELVTLTGQVVAEGAGEGCDSPFVLLPSDVDTGEYLLRLTANEEAAGGTGRLASDQVSLPITVVANATLESSEGGEP